jgi:Leu/Phe-tRNA-protein transferase
MSDIDDVIFDGQYYDSFTSSNIVGFRYDIDSEELYVDFNQGSYVYYGVDSDTVVSWMQSDSKGIFHAAFIKYSFSFSKL